MLNETRAGARALIRAVRERGIVATVSNTTGATGSCPVVSFPRMQRELTTGRSSISSRSGAKNLA